MTWMLQVEKGAIIMKKDALGSIYVYYDKSRCYWRGRIITGQKPDGSYEYKSVHADTEDEVRSKLATIKYMIDNKIDIAEKKTLLYYINKVNKKRALNIEQSSRGRRADTAISIASYPIANMPIAQISEDDILDFLSSISEDYSYSVIDKQFGIVKAAFRAAVKDRVISINLLDDIQRPKSKKQKKKVEALSKSDEIDLIDVLYKELKEYDWSKFKQRDSNYSTQLLLQLFTGMRCGEVNALSFEDIDLDNRRINIRHSVSHCKAYVRKDGTLDFDSVDRDYFLISDNKKKKLHEVTFISSTKTGKSRTIPLDDNAYRVMKNYVDNIYPLLKRKFITDSPHGKVRLLFWSENQSTNKLCPISTSRCNSWLKRIIQKEQICLNTKSAVTSHVMRHTYATRCVEAGVPSPVLKNLLGHQNIHITIDTYYTLFDESKQDAIDITAQYLINNGLSIPDFSSSDD